MLQELNLTKSALGEDLLAEDVGHLLDGDALVGLAIDSGAVEKSRSASAFIIRIGCVGAVGLGIDMFGAVRRIVDADGDGGVEGQGG